MIRTTINLDNTLFKTIKIIAKRENRSAPNFIETILIRYLKEDFYVDDFEMEDLHRDTSLKKTIRQSLSDYKKGRGRFV